jgi:hypothetical protein
MSRIGASIQADKMSVPLGSSLEEEAKSHQRLRRQLPSVKFQ